METNHFKEWMNYNLDHYSKGRVTKEIGAGNKVNEEFKRHFKIRDISPDLSESKIFIKIQKYIWTALI